MEDAPIEDLPAEDLSIEVEFGDRDFTNKESTATETASNRAQGHKRHLSSTNQQGIEAGPSKRPSKPYETSTTTAPITTAASLRSPRKNKGKAAPVFEKGENPVRSRRKGAKGRN